MLWTPDGIEGVFQGPVAQGGLQALQTQDPHIVRGDAHLNPDMKPLSAPPTPAAVLLPLIDHADGASVLLTKRTSHLKAHAGQIAFPGGRIDPGDRDPHVAALRETEEEVGIDRSQVKIVGELPPYLTRTGYIITPVIGRIRPPIAPIAEPAEVAEIFEVPLSFLLNRANHQRHSRTIAGVPRQFYAMPYKDYYIWGATAGMIVSLANTLDRLRDPS